MTRAPTKQLLKIAIKSTDLGYVLQNLNKQNHEIQKYTQMLRNITKNLNKIVKIDF